MEFRSRANQSQPAARPAQPVRQSAETESTNGGMNMNMKQPVNSHSSKRKWIMIAVAVVAIILLIMGGFYAKKAMFSSEGTVQSDKYQALFLTNGQVYFGHLSGIDNDYVKLTNIYYLQVQQSVQPEQNQQQQDQQQQPQVSLTKLGGELHGPEDNMYVARDQVLFWENLKDDSKVVQAIKSDKK